jgi:uncharacterized protein with HEPN domain
MKRKSEERIKDILHNIEQILKASKNKTLTDFENDFILVAAVIRWLEVIGEASKYVSKDIKNKYSDIPWKEMAGMRDVAIHDYADIKIDRIFYTVKKDIPPLKEKMEKIILQS